ncbi:MAG: tetratricopeptide repeat protein [Candidatus Scalindua sp.]|nr:tetratricopeptide repeat protein [Candidatus Scalindua sp.]
MKSDQTQMKDASAVAIKDRDGESVIEEMVNKLEDEKKELEKLKNQFEKINQMSKKIIESNGHAVETPTKGEKELKDNFVTEDKVFRVGNYREEGSIRSEDFEEKEIKKDETGKIKIKEKEEIVKPFEIAENLYKMEEYELSLDIYLLIEEENVDAENRSWIKYQIANCYRKLKKFDKAVHVYKEVQSEFKDSYWAKQSQWYIKNIEWDAGRKEKLEMVVE